MGARGPAPKPVELKIRQGNPGQRPLPVPLTTVSNLSSVDELPPSASGTEMMQWVLDHGGSTWISPTDVTFILAGRLWDAVAVAETRFMDTGDMDAYRQFKGLSEELHRCLGKLGLTPTDRSALGLAHVKAKSKLEEMRERRRSRAGRQDG